MSRLNLKFKNFSVRFWLAILGAQSSSMSMLNLKLKIYSELPVGDIGEIDHLSMSRLNLKFKIYSELLVGKKWGRENHSQTMPLSELCLLHHQRSFLTKDQSDINLRYSRPVLMFWCLIIEVFAKSAL